MVTPHVNAPGEHPHAGRDSDPAEDAATTLIDVQAVAKLLACSPRHVYRLCDAGKMPRPMKLGALVRWSKSQVISWIAGGCKPTGGKGAA